MTSFAVPARPTTLRLLPLPLLLLAALHVAAAEETPSPLLVGPVRLGPADAAAIPAASYRVTFREDGERAGVELTFQVNATTETLLGFAGRGVAGLAATIDGAPAQPEYSITPLPVSGGPFDTQLLVRVPPATGTPHTVEVTARCDTRFEQRDPALAYPEATFILNQSIEGPRAWFLRLDPASAAGADLRMRVETVAPRRPEAPVAGTPVETPDGVVLEGPVVADTAAAIEVAALDGDYPPVRRWAFALGLGLVLDWPHVARTDTDSSGRIVESWYATPSFHDPTPRFWISGLFQYAWEHWLLSTGLEGDPLGVLEVPLLFTWFPQAREPGEFGAPNFDYRFLFGVALQVFNTASPAAWGLDFRPFVRIGAGIRFHVMQAEIFYEAAPPVGEWNGPRGLVEHKLGFTFPFAF